jgi:hypothetical protein
MFTSSELYKHIATAFFFDDDGFDLVWCWWLWNIINLSRRSFLSCILCATLFHTIIITIIIINFLIVCVNAKAIISFDVKST